MSADPAQADLITELERFVERGQTAQRHIDNILRMSDQKARGRPRARGTDPQTSHKAAQRAAAGLTAKQEAVLACFQQRYDVDMRHGENPVIAGGMTDPQFLLSYKSAVARELTNWPAQSESGLRTRRHELVVKNKLQKLGVVEREKGKPFTLWGVTR